MDSNTVQSKWYDKNWLVVLLCFVFFPVGLYGLWKSTSIKKVWKIVLTVVVVIFVINVFTENENNRKNNSANNDSNNSSVQSNIPELTQQQKDSIAHIERQKFIEIQKSQTITAGDLVSQYEANEVSADNNFKGKSFYVQGYIDNIGKDILNDIYVTFSVSGSFRGVQCFIDDKDAVGLLKKGQRITIKGECKGLMMNVLMKNCVIVEDL